MIFVFSRNFMARAFVKFFDTSRARRPGFSTSEPWRRAPAAVAIERVASSGLGDARVLNHLSRIGQRSTPDTAPEADAESAWLDLPPGEAPDAMRQLIGRSVTYRIAVGPQAGRKALVLRTIRPLAGEEPRNERVAKANGFSLHAGVSCEARERLCRYDVQGCTSVAGGRMPGATIARPAVAEKRLTVNAQGKVVYLLKTPYRDGTTHVVLLRASCPPPLRGQPSAAQNRSRRFCRTPGLNRASGSASAEAACKPDQIPRGTGTEPPLACGGDAGRKGQGEEGGCSAREVHDRAACGDELGTAAEAGLWHRRGELRALRQGGAGCRSCASMRPRH